MKESQKALKDLQHAMKDSQAMKEFIQVELCNSVLLKRKPRSLSRLPLQLVTYLDASLGLA
uniref:Uncharacterized protein n=1 Tax=Rhizophora mucronata TaxID=61149 RepID=A0A2P2N369_RHIMU